MKERTHASESDATAGPPKEAAKPAQTAETPGPAETAGSTPTEVVRWVAPREPWGRRLARGALAGALATVAMSGVQGFGALRARRAPPPVSVTRRLAQRVTRRTPPPPQRYALGALLHLGFGTMAGACYGLVAPRPAPEVTATAYAGAIYGASYLGALPVLDLYPSPKREDRRRDHANRVAHLVYGLTLGLATRVLRASGSTTPPRTTEPAGV